MKIAWILPGSPADEQNMIFARRSVPVLQSRGIDLQLFFVADRLSPLSLYRSWKELRQKLAIFYPDYVHAQYGSMLGFFSLLLGWPLIVTFRGSDVNGDPSLPVWRRKLTYLLSWVTAQRAAKVICVSRPLADTLSVSNAHILPSPLDLELFLPISVTEARQHLKLSFTKKVVAFAGGDRPLKRRDLAKQAVELAGMELLDIRGVSPDQMPLWINAADVLIFTSEREGSPNIVREALACGVPVVSVNVGDVSKWLELDASSTITEASSEALSFALTHVTDSIKGRSRRADLSSLSLEEHAKKLVLLYSKETH